MTKQEEFCRTYPEHSDRLRAEPVRGWNQYRPVWPRSPTAYLQTRLARSHLFVLGTDLRRHLLGPRLEQSQCNRAKPPKTELSSRYYSSHLHRLRRESAQAQNRYRFVQPHSPTVSCRARLWHSRQFVSGSPEPRSLSGESRPHSKQPP